MKRVLVFATVLVLVLSMAGCGGDATQTIKSDESPLALTFPASWRNEELHDEASIEMARATQEQYMMVLEESQQDFETSITLEVYTQYVSDNMTGALGVTSTPTFNNVTIGEKQVSAKQFELSGSVDNIKVSYLITCADVDGYFYQFIAWSLQSKYDAAKTVFADILNSATF